MQTIDYSKNETIRAIAKTIGFSVNDETTVFRMTAPVDFAYEDYTAYKHKIAGFYHHANLVKLSRFLSDSFDVCMGFAPTINTIAVYVPTKAASQ